MHKAITMCYRPSTKSVFQLEIPENILEKAISIRQTIDNDSPDDVMTSYLLQYISQHAPNAGKWDIEIEPLFRIVNCDDDLDTMEDKDNCNTDIEKYWDSLNAENVDDDELYLGDTDNE